jgi:hypothetical protein
MQMISIFLEQNHVSLYASTYSLSGFDKKKIISKGCKGQNFFNHLASCLYSLYSQFLVLGIGHMCKK